MKLRVLGCSGGIGGELRTTSLLLDHDTLIDAGTGVGDLSISELAQIDHVFVTHLKPRESELIMQQIAVAVKERRLQMLQNNHVFEF